MKGYDREKCKKNDIPLPRHLSFLSFSLFLYIFTYSFIMLSTIVRSSRPIFSQNLPRASFIHSCAIIRNAASGKNELLLLERTLVNQYKKNKHNRNHHYHYHYSYYTLNTKKTFFSTKRYSLERHSIFKRQARSSCIG